MAVVAGSIQQVLEVSVHDHSTTDSRVGTSTQYCEALQGEAYELGHRNYSGSPRKVVPLPGVVRVGVL
jgi:hypothetical protein